jgi:hypothetical protein
MILCAQCGKKNKDNATVCKYCGYNPAALQGGMSWNYQNGNYNVPYTNNGVSSANNNSSYYYDEKGNAYNVKYDYVVTPVGQNDEEEGNYEETEHQQMSLYPYNPTQVQQTPVSVPQKQPNAMAWVGYILALFIDILAWPFCLIGLSIAGKRGGAKRALCEGGMMLTLLRLISVALLFLVWWGVSSFIPTFFVGFQPWKGAVVKIALFGWPILVGSIFSQAAPEGSGLEAAGRGHFYFSIALAVIGLIFLDASILPIFSAV